MSSLFPSAAMLGMIEKFSLHNDIMVIKLKLLIHSFSLAFSVCTWGALMIYKTSLQMGRKIGEGAWSIVVTAFAWLQHETYLDPLTLITNSDSI